MATNSREKLKALRAKTLNNNAENKDDNFTTQVIKELEEDIDKKTDNENTVDTAENASIEQKQTNDRNTANTTEKKVSVKKETTGKKVPLKLVAPKKDKKTVKIGFAMTPLAKDNITKYAKDAGYKSVNDFVNDLFEHLDDYLR